MPADGRGLHGSEQTSEGSQAPIAIVRGSAVNQDGRSSSLTAPNGPSQQALVAACLLEAAMEAAAVALAAVHGTGTPLGDPIEVGALAGVLRSPAGGQTQLALSSNKVCITTLIFDLMHSLQWMARLLQAHINVMP